MKDERGLHLKKRQYHESQAGELCQSDMIVSELTTAKTRQLLQQKEHGGRNKMQE